ncbi:hypothetical protein ACFLZ0_00715 [Patescibacteria group bacterium]
MVTNPLEAFIKYLAVFYIFLAILGRFLLSVWWIYTPVIFYILALDLWLKHIRNKFINKMEWILLEVIPPSDVKKTPKAMEQFFTALHASQGNPNWKEMNIDGKTQVWFSMEMVSHGGEIHFFIRTTSFFRNFIESQIYAQYPEAEIVQAQDYVNSMPVDIPNDNYDLWGTEFVLTKEDAYPIKTHPAFDKDVVEEEQRIDPMSSLMEVLGKIGYGENIWIQTLVRPINDKWKKEGEKIRDRLIKRVVDVTEGEITKEIKAWMGEGRSQISFLVSGEGWEAQQEEKKKDNPLTMMTKGEADIVKAVEDDIAKFGFEVIIRFLYLAPSDNFNRINIPSVIGAYKQFGSQNLNGFKPNGKVTTSIDYTIQMKGPRETYRKKKIFEAYRKREFVQHSKYIDYLKPFFFEKFPILNWFFLKSQPFVLNTEELATVYHYPSVAVKSPLVPKVEAKKGEPPISLPVE